MVTPFGEVINHNTRRNTQNVEIEVTVQIDDKKYVSKIHQKFVGTNKIEVKVSTENKTSLLNIEIHQLTSKISKIDNLVYDVSVKSTIIQDDKSSNFLYIAEKDENGREKSRTMISKGEVIFHQLITYSNRNQVQ
jgi:hypothetical protein